MTMNKDILKLRQLMEQLADRDMKLILQAYKKSLEEVRTEIAKLYTKYAVDGSLTMTKRQRYTVLKQLEKQLLQLAKELGHIDLGHTTKILESIYEQSFYRSAFIIDKGLDVAINFSLLRPEFIKAAVEIPIEGVMFSDRIWKNKQQLVNRLRRDISKAMIDGTSIDKLARMIKKDFNISAYESRRLIHTELARCQSQAQDDIYKQSGVVKRVMYDATLDNKTSNICRSLDGEIFDINSDYPKPPQHPNCRSCIVPVVNGWSPTKKRDNQTKEVIDYTSYESWAKSKGIN